MSLKKILTNLFFFLFIIWVALGFVNVLYNTAKSVVEVKEWGFLSQDQKKQKIFGDYYLMQSYLAENSQSQNIYIYTQDPMAFFVARYFLYPQRIYWIMDKEDFLGRISEKKSGVYFIYKSDIDIYKQKTSSTFVDGSKKKGYLIKI